MYGRETAQGIPFYGLSDEDMLQAQYALDDRDQRIERIQYLKRLLSEETNSD